MSSLRGKTLFITGASRGIGKAIALRAAQDGANIIIAAKSVDENPKLGGTIYSAAEEIEKAGGKALACVVDVRDYNQIVTAVEAGVKKFGGIDIVVNNASAINLTGTLATDPKRYDLMHNINGRGTFMTSKACLPYLLKSSNPHILNISPPLSMDPKWFKNHVAYTMAKYNMSMCVLGMAAEFHGKVGVNALWPRTSIATAAVANLLGGDSVVSRSRKPEIMADAAWHVLTKDCRTCTGNFFVDDDVLASAGITNLDSYCVDPKYKDSLIMDFFLDTADASNTFPSKL